jgi:hypothetical protein
MSEQTNGNDGGPWILVAGDVVEGFIFVGPFDKHDGPGGAMEGGETLWGDSTAAPWGTAPLVSFEEQREKERKVGRG